MGGGNAEDPYVVSVLEYWNKPKDEYIVLMNGVWINPGKNDVCQGFASPSKEIPLVVYTDHYLEDSIY